MNILEAKLEHQMKINFGKLWKIMKTTLLFLMIYCYQNKHAILMCFFKWGQQSKIDIYYISQSYFHLPKKIVLFLIQVIKTNSKGHQTTFS